MHMKQVSAFLRKVPPLFEKANHDWNNTTTTGVLFIKADTKATSTNKISINLRYPYLQNFPNSPKLAQLIYNDLKTH